MSGQKALTPIPPARRPGTLASLYHSMTSWRTASVVLLSFSSGLPLGLVWIAVPDWMRSAGVDIRVVGLITLSQAPWTFKFMWSPVMDRYVPPFLGRRRGWMVLAQVALLLTTALMAGLGSNPDLPWVVGAVALAIAFASATQDIAIDAYTVDVLRPEEQGVAVGARVALYRGGMLAAGGGAITLASYISWPITFAILAAVYLPMILLAVRSPEPETAAPAPRSLKAAVWHPFLGFLARHRALEILAFVVFYKLADNLGGALLRPFLSDMGYDAWHRGFAIATVSIFTQSTGAIAGGACTNLMGLGNALWFFGVIQIVSNVGYIFVAQSPEPNLPLMYIAIGFEQFTQGLGTGAFGVLLIRLTQKRFSATQFALFTSLFGIPRALAGPVSGFLVHALGWTNFFWVTIIAGIPGLVLLARFVPPGTREPIFTVAEPVSRAPLTKTRMLTTSVIAGVVAAVTGVLTVALMNALTAFRSNPDAGILYRDALAALFRPVTVTDWWMLAAIATFAVVTGLFAAAVLAARHGAGPPPEEPAAEPASTADLD